MVRYFFIFVLLVIYLSPAIRAEEVIIPITSKIAGNDDPKEKNTWERDNRLSLIHI